MREYTPGKRHPDVYCKHCNEKWTSNQKARVITHLEFCKELPRHMWAQYQPVRFENGGVAPVPEKRSRITDNVSRDPDGAPNGDAGAGVAYVTPSFPTLAAALRNEDMSETKEQLEMELLLLQMQRNDIERKELEVKLKLQRMA